MAVYADLKIIPVQSWSYISFGCAAPCTSANIILGGTKPCNELNLQQTSKVEVNQKIAIY